MANIPDNQDLNGLFQHDSDNSDTNENFIEFNVAGKKFILSLADEEFNLQRKTLFATKLWPGSMNLCEYLANNQHLIEFKKIIEFGAGAALPSLVSTFLKADFVCCTDFPVPTILDNIKSNFLRNYDNIIPKNMSILGHVWGSDVDLLLQTVSSHIGVVDDTKYDVAIASECIWKPDCHDILLKSMSQVLCIGGHALITFSNHIPGLEDAYLQFFKLAEGYHFVVVETIEMQGRHMWSDKTIPIFLYILKLT